MTGAGGMKVVPRRLKVKVSDGRSEPPRLPPPPLLGGGSMWSGAEGCVGAGETLGLMRAVTFVRFRHGA